MIDGNATLTFSPLQPWALLQRSHAVLMAGTNRVHILWNVFLLLKLYLAEPVRRGYPGQLLCFDA